MDHCSIFRTVCSSHAALSNGLALVEALRLAASDLAAIEVDLPKDSAAGARYTSAAMADFHSEK